MGESKISEWGWLHRSMLLQGPLWSNATTRILTVVLIFLLSVSIKVLGAVVAVSPEYDDKVCCCCLPRGIVPKILAGLASALIDVDLLLTDHREILNSDGCITDRYAKYMVFVANWGWVTIVVSFIVIMIVFSCRKQDDTPSPPRKAFLYAIAFFIFFLGVPCVVYFGLNYRKIDRVVAVVAMIEIVVDAVTSFSCNTLLLPMTEASVKGL